MVYSPYPGYRPMFGSRAQPGFGFGPQTVDQTSGLPVGSVVPGSRTVTPVGRTPQARDSQGQDLGFRGFQPSFGSVDPSAYGPNRPPFVPRHLQGAYRPDQSQGFRPYEGPFAGLLTLAGMNPGNPAPGAWDYKPGPSQRAQGQPQSPQGQAPMMGQQGFQYDRRAIQADPLAFLRQMGQARGYGGRGGLPEQLAPLLNPNIARMQAQARAGANGNPLQLRRELLNQMQAGAAF